MSIPVELLEGPVRDVDGPAAAGKDGLAAMNEAVEEVLFDAHPLHLALRPLPRALPLYNYKLGSNRYSSRCHVPNIQDDFYFIFYKLIWGLNGNSH